MANDKKKVSAGKPKIGGAIYRAPLGTPLPTSASETLNPGFVCMGYASDDGVTNSNKASTSNIKAWGGDIVLVIQSEKTDTVAFTLLETMSEDVLAAVHGPGNVSGTLMEGISVEVNADLQEDAEWVIDMMLNANTAKRIVIPDAAISDMADVVYKDDEAIGYGVTLTCMPDGDGNTHYEYIKGTPVGTVTLDKTTETVAAGSTKTITATTDPVGGTVKWSTADSDIATVTGGVVTGVAAGTVVITARVPATGAVAYCTVTVTGE